MGLYRLPKHFKSCVIGSKASKCFATAVRNEEEYTATPQYPPILDLSFDSKLERKKQAVYEEIKNVKTIEEKQIKLNMPRYYGFKSYMLREDVIPYNSLDLIQHITRTHLIVNNNLPDFYKNVQVDDLIPTLKSEVEDALLLELDGYRRFQDIKKEELTTIERENLISSSIVRQINRTLVNNLIKTHKHPANVQVDLDPRIESRGTQVNYPLNPIVPYSEAENPDLDVPYFQYDPRVFGTDTEHRHMANVPGFWVGSPYRFGLIWYHKRGHMLGRTYGDPQDDKEALHRQGILASFAWLHSQANLLGFTTFNDITYPMVTQTVITNGKIWSLYAYQLNTILVHGKNITGNRKKNICWATEEIKLYDDVNDGKIVGFNDDLLKMLLQFYANEPESRLGVNLTPYLNGKEKVCADYEDDDKRQWLEREYKYLVSNRPRYKLPYEIYDWERIYKIKHQTRFMEKRLRPFELFQHPYREKAE
ncbi:hypothetical protein NQ317_010145 [Molorchus minor]|uniref:28S ribosomal protein S30, mitochondrial n=1 Tax=Molorchus minor TaxID=1323400 RepID=A0ABQ9JG35_9CUCU|nr:hypothetical protein NQ317_010145 [Molorchus minor]